MTASPGAPTGESAGQNVSTTNEYSGLSGGVIAGIVIGVFALLAILAAVAVLLYRKEKRRTVVARPNSGPDLPEKRYQVAEAPTQWMGSELAANDNKPFSGWAHEMPGHQNASGKVQSPVELG